MDSSWVYKRDKLIRYSSRPTSKFELAKDLKINSAIRLLKLTAMDGPELMTTDCVLDNGYMAKRV